MRDTSPSGISTDNPYRLPRTAVPARYDIELRPDLRERTFTGTVTVTLEVQADGLSELVCNAADLALVEATVEQAGVRSRVRSIALDAAAERATFGLATPLTAGTARLTVEFTGTLNDKLTGFYSSTYTGDDGETRTIAATQMESTDARRAFPCWDEPDLKAVFAISVVVADGLLVVSNSPVIAEVQHAAGQRRVSFADTMIMSTYLVCVVVGELEATPAIDVDGTPLRVIARPGQSHLTGFALEIGAFALRYFSSYFDIPYPGDKLDLIALPDFAFGAMENLGAVTFREALLVVDRDRATHAELERIADVVAHEIAHMWFGDLVTMTWWNGLWLNEAFATFAEVACVAAFRPEWDRWTSFSISRAAAMGIDGLHATRPIEFPVVSPADANGMFDLLTYEKGASVLRMLEQYLGEERFRDGVRHYLKSRSYANADTTDLWDAIESVTGEPVRTMMDGWIFRGGFPVVDLEADGTSLRFSQGPFRYLGARPALGEAYDHPLRTGPTDANNNTNTNTNTNTNNNNSGSANEAPWYTPVLWSTTLGKGDPFGLGSEERTMGGRTLLDRGQLTVGFPGPITSVIGNAGGHGFYRVRYQGELRSAVAKRLSSLATVERYTTVSDLWAFVLEGTAAATDFLELVTASGSERDPNVVAALLEGLRDIDAIVDGRAREGLQHRVATLLGPIAGDIGWSRQANEGALVGQLRAMTFSALGTLGEHRPTQVEATAMLDRWFADPSALDPDAVPAVIAIGAHLGGDARYGQYLAARASAATPQDQLRLLQSLSGFTEPSLVARTLDSCLSEFRSQDAPFVLRQLLASREAGPATWQFLTAHWNEVLARLPDNIIVRLLGSLPALAKSHPEIVDQAVAFFADPARLPQGHRSFAQTLEQAEAARRLRERERDRLTSALS